MGTTMGIECSRSHQRLQRSHVRRWSHSFKGTWPEVAVGLGLGLSVVWTFFLGYGLIKLAHLAILEIAS